MTNTKHSDYPNQHLLIDIHGVEDNKGASNIVLLDARAQGYEVGHIPGAIWINVKDLKDDSRRTFASEAIFRSSLEKCGVSNETTVVVYDEGSGVLATRLFYLLEYYGLKDQVKLLNGGYNAWAAAGKEISTLIPSVSEGRLIVSTDTQRVTTLEDIGEGLRNSQILDVRSLEEYTGADQRSNRKGGHIKGAIHKEWKEALGPADKDGVIKFKDYLSLKQEFEAAGLRPDKTIVPYCQSNQRGAHTYFILRLIGYSDVRPYEGSWDEWGNTETTEIER